MFLFNKGKKIELDTLQLRQLTTVIKQIIAHVLLLCFLSAPFTADF